MKCKNSFILLVPDSVLGTEDTGGNKTDKKLGPGKEKDQCGISICVRKQ